jgi:hypothetical protein
MAAIVGLICIGLGSAIFAAVEIVRDVRRADRF